MLKQQTKRRSRLILKRGKNSMKPTKALDRWCRLALWPTLPVEKLVFINHRCFQAAGYPVVVNDDPNKKYASTKAQWQMVLSSSHHPKQNFQGMLQKSWSFTWLLMSSDTFSGEPLKQRHSWAVANYWPKVSKQQMIPRSLSKACNLVLQPTSINEHIQVKIKDDNRLLFYLNLEAIKSLKIKKNFPRKWLEEILNPQPQRQTDRSSLTPQTHIRSQNTMKFGSRSNNCKVKSSLSYWSLQSHAFTSITAQRWNKR